MCCNPAIGREGGGLANRAQLHKLGCLTADHDQSQKEPFNYARPLPHC
jgi:hypothetical protein